MKGTRSALQRLLHSAELKLALPSYSGCVLLGLAGFFFIAATNTLSGWLYVMSGVILALMAIALWLVRQNLRGLTVTRQVPEPVSVGDSLYLRLTLHNGSAQPKTLLKLVDRLPPALGRVRETVVVQVPPYGTAVWQDELPVTRRGIYHWQQVQLRTGAPLGLFWASQQQVVPIRAIVHPQVLPLNRCPLIDQMGGDPSLQVLSQQLAQASPEGMTRSLRPYRWGDSMRLIHWRTSAKLGELRVRELETFTSGQAIVIALDTTKDWEIEAFEQAVTAAATLYFYALRQQLQVSLWTASTGLVQGNRSVLDTLAAVNPNEWLGSPPARPLEPLLWLTARSQSLGDLPNGSRWLFWRSGLRGAMDSVQPGLVMSIEEPLELQLTRSLDAAR
jgi:uncharacterized protein (DUF58 family)